MSKKSQKERGSTRSKSASKNRTSRGIFNFIFSPGVLIFLLVVVSLGLLYWFLPEIIQWFGETSRNITGLLGIGIIVILLLCLIVLIILLSRKSSLLIKYWHQWIGLIFLLFFFWALGTYINPDLGGIFGNQLFGESTISQIIILFALLFLTVLCFAPGWTWLAVKKLFIFLWRIIKQLLLLINKGIRKVFTKESHVKKEKTHSIIKAKPVPILHEEEKLPVEVKEKESYQPKITPGGWKLPPISILDKVPEPEVSESDVEKRAELIVQALGSYGVDAKVIQINVGTTVTQFGVEPGWDIKYKEVRERDRDGNIKIKQQEVSRTRVKVERINALANDLALALAASSIRIEAPVPGKPIVGIEVPNSTFGSVNLRSIIESTNYQKIEVKSKLAIPLGKGVGGEVVAGDLAKMPHLLIAGSTGSGKTVYINSIICCLLFYNTPDDLRFIMIDPKRVELVNFNNLPQLIAPVVVDTDKAVMSLRWLTNEMDRRYKKFAEAGARNIDAYNKSKVPGESMPFIVLIIDELADLMMTAFGEVEQNLCRLAQLSRATGIHLIVATQRPSVDVITGLIKANFPTRISFSLTSQIDSRTILDTPGAEKLLGRGDMLYMPTDASKPKRLQGPFLSDTEIDRLVQFWGDQKRPETTQIKFEEIELKSSSLDQEEDPILKEARQLATDHTGISTSFLQRKLKIGYPRAARIMEKLKEEGF